MLCICKKNIYDLTYIVLHMILYKHITEHLINHKVHFELVQMYSSKPIYVIRCSGTPLAGHKFSRAGKLHTEHPSRCPGTGDLTLFRDCREQVPWNVNIEPKRRNLRPKCCKHCSSDGLCIGIVHLRK